MLEDLDQIQSAHDQWVDAFIALHQGQDDVQPEAGTWAEASLPPAAPALA